MGRLYLTQTLVAISLIAPPVIWGQSVQDRGTGAKPAPSAFATLRGVVRDAGSHLVAGATVLLQAQDALTLRVRSDSVGAYRFPTVRQGSYTLRVEKDGEGRTTIGVVIFEPKESKTIDITLESSNANVQPNSAAVRPEFFDEPHFNVAGVTDTTNLSGHGSDTIVRNREALADATAALSKPAAGDSAYADTGDYARARQNLQALINAPDKPDQEKAQLHHLLGDVDEKLGDSLEAVREYQRAAELNPSEANLFDWGAELLTHHAAEPAIEVFTKGNRLFPRSVRMLAGLGAAWYSLGSYDQAAKSFCEASDLNPSDPSPYLFMGKMQSAEATQSPAIAERLARFAALQPENALANYYQAVSLWQGRKSPDDFATVKHVRSLLEKTVHLDSKLGLAYLQLGMVYAEQKDLPRAISAYQQAVEATPSLEQAHYRLAQAYKQAGETAKAHSELQLYEEISQEKTQEIERQRHELQQFVYRLRDPSPTSQPQ
jgi:tetratricopeptide (TPR) repeat protein